MACGGGKYPKDFFKKDKMSYVSKDTSIRKNSSEEKISITDDSEKERIDDVSDSLMGLNIFNKEDKIIAKLFREVVEEIKTVNKLKESEVRNASEEIADKIRLAHRREFRRFPGIDFCIPKNRCAYLIRYAICHTGLVKELMWYFFKAKGSSCKKARDIILNSDLRKVVSLGGGPGNDLIGFCSALEEIPNKIKELHLKIVDISQGWKSVFPLILEKARRSNFGSVSEFLKKVRIDPKFLQRDLLEDKIFDDRTLSTILGEVDIVLMVKFVSFIHEQEAGELIQNVVNSMKEGAYLIFIDYPFNANFFGGVQGLACIYKRENFKYELTFRPSKFQMESVEETHGNICIFCKEIAED